ncbi:hypothetical protein ACO1PF_00495 [Alkalibacterium sp. f15]|uniref:hypothetical protein n=1 Tax=Alkalibacterium sp. f15 TaxID=3414029 RepID=UPI003BF778CB
MEDFKQLAIQIYRSFTAIYENSHALVNRDEEVKYPYITYDLRTYSTLARNQENLVIDVQIFDNIKSYSRTYDVASLLKNHFKGRLIKDDSFHIRFDVQRGATNFIHIPTSDPNIIRLEGTVQAKIDWRENR